MTERTSDGSTTCSLKRRVLSWVRFSSTRASGVFGKNKDRSLTSKAAGKSRSAENLGAVVDAEARESHRSTENFTFARTDSRKSILKSSTASEVRPRSSGDEPRPHCANRGHVTFDEKLLPRTSTKLALTVNHSLNTGLTLSPISVPGTSGKPRVGCQVGCPVSPELKTICSSCQYKNRHKEIIRTGPTNGQTAFNRLKFIKESQEGLLLADDEASLVSTFQVHKKHKCVPERAHHHILENKENRDGRKSAPGASQSVKSVTDKCPLGPRNTVQDKSTQRKEGSSKAPSIAAGKPVSATDLRTRLNANIVKNKQTGSTLPNMTEWYDVEDSLEKTLVSGKDERSLCDLSVFVERAVKESLEKLLAENILPMLCSPTLLDSLSKKYPKIRPLPPTPGKDVGHLYENVETLRQSARSLSSKSFHKLPCDNKSELRRSTSFPLLKQSSSSEVPVDRTDAVSDIRGDYVNLRGLTEAVGPKERTSYVNIQKVLSHEELSSSNKCGRASQCSQAHGSDSWEDAMSELDNVTVQENRAPVLGNVKRRVLCSPAKLSPVNKYKYKAQDVLCGKAKLKIQIGFKQDRLIMHVVRASQLTSCRSHQVNAYVRISLEPDPVHNRQWRSRVVRGSSSPLFNHKLSIELLPGDEKKRLLISIWHRDIINKRSEFLGCMTFGLSQVVEGGRAVQGWYRLLTLALGSQKHFAVTNKQTSKTLNFSEQDPPAKGPCISRSWLV